MSAHLAEAFLRLLFDDAPGHIEFRLIEDKGGKGVPAPPRIEFFDSPDTAIRTLPKMQEWAEKRGCAVFFGVLPRAEKRGSKAAVAPGMVAWVDLDFKATAEADAEASLALLPPASIVVRSGHGLHLYWLMKEATAPEELESLSRRLAHFLHADTRCSDASRILRLPGTLNLKEGWATGSYVAPAAATVVLLPRCNGDLRYIVDDFDLVPNVPVVATSAAKATEQQRATAARSVTTDRGRRTLDAIHAKTAALALQSTGKRTGLWGLAHVLGRAARDGQVSIEDGVQCMLAALRVPGSTVENFDIAETAIRDGIDAGMAEVPDEPPPPGDADAPPPAEPPTRPEPERDERPILVLSGDRLHALRRAWEIVLAANDPPTWYTQGGAMVDLHTPKDAPPAIRRVSPTLIAARLVRLARCVRIDPRTQDRMPCGPPEAFLADMHAVPDPALPVLDAIVSAPVLDRHGRLVATPGFDATSGLYYRPSPGMESIDVADTSRQTVHDARDNLLKQWLGEFPYESDADRAHALALVLLPFLRRMIDGPTPLHLVEAAERGTGKTLLAQLALAPFLGHLAEPAPLADADEEVRKGITAALLARKGIIFYDNLEGRLDAPGLCVALTSVRWEDRVLGASSLVSLPNSAVWVASANNLEMSVDLARRSVRLRLNRKMERPWEWKAQRKDIRTWTQANRRALTESALTLCLAWVRAGCPAPTASPSLGSYEDWSRVLGGVLEHAGVPGFLANARELYDSADPKHAEWREFVTEWWHAKGAESCSPATLVRLADEHSLLSILLAGANGDRSKVSRLGKGLAKQRGRVFAGLQIDAVDGAHGREYALKEAEPEAVPPRQPRPPAPTPPPPRAPWYD